MPPGSKKLQGRCSLSVRPPGATTPQLDRAGEVTKGTAEISAKIKLLGLCISFDKDLILTNQQQGIGKANATNVVHSAAVLQGESTG